MSTTDSTNDLQIVKIKMDALRSALLQYSEKHIPAQSSLSEPLHLPLMHSIVTIQEAMRTFLTLANARNN